MPQFPPLGKVATASMAGASPHCGDRIPKQPCLSAGRVGPHGVGGWACLGREGKLGCGETGNHLSSQGEGSTPCFSGLPLPSGA